MYNWIYIDVVLWLNKNTLLILKHNGMVHKKYSINVITEVQYHVTNDNFPMRFIIKYITVQHGIWNIIQERITRFESRGILMAVEGLTFLVCTEK
jgi:hypothetical protein